jgi:hypothetical protein
LRRQLVNNNSVIALDETLAAIDKVSADTVSQVSLVWSFCLLLYRMLTCQGDHTQTVTTLLKSKPTTVAIGNSHQLPYADSLGL